MKIYQIAASILSANFACLGEEVNKVIAAGADLIHFDVMDNHYVPNLTVGPLICKSLRDYGITATIDAHLMVQPVDRLIQDFAKAGATYISFHPDATENVAASIKLIHDHGCKAGLAFNPETPLTELEELLPNLDLVLIMSVHPGFGSQEFIAEVLPKIEQAKTLIDSINPKVLLEVDGGIKIDNIQTIATAGANVFVAGSAIFGSQNYQKTITKMRQKFA